jgi:hypothetical protein
MPRGEKSKTTDKLERKADYVADGYEKKSLPHKKADKCVWSTDNKYERGGQKRESASNSVSGTPAPHAGVPLTRNAQAGTRQL